MRTRRSGQPRRTHPSKELVLPLENAIRPSLRGSLTLQRKVMNKGGVTGKEEDGQVSWAASLVDLVAFARRRACGQRGGCRLGSASDACDSFGDTLPPSFSHRCPGGRLAHPRPPCLPPNSRNVLTVSPPAPPILLPHQFEFCPGLAGAAD